MFVFKDLSLDHTDESSIVPNEFQDKDEKLML